MRIMQSNKVLVLHAASRIEIHNVMGSDLGGQTASPQIRHFSSVRDIELQYMYTTIKVLIC
jgi:hypothetical protein